MRLAFIWLICSSYVRAQDEIFVPPGYASEYEYVILHKETATNLELLLTSGGQASSIMTERIQKDLDGFVEGLIVENLPRLSEAKLVKALHGKIHDRYLKKYALISPFYRIFESGEYNCVSATALFALVLEKLNIPYNIQELPTHVYLIAWPGTKNIVVEMTSPKDGYFVPSKREVTRVVNSLREYKLIDQNTMAGKDDREIYNLVLYQDKVINLRELAGLQYFNEAIVALETDNYKVAFDEIVKSELLYSSNKTKLFKSQIVLNLVESTDFNNANEFRYLLIYAQMPESNPDRVRYEYTKLLDKQLLHGGSRKFVDSTFRMISNELNDTLLKKRLSELYYLGMSEYYSNAFNLTKQLEYSEKAYKTSPESMNAQSWFANSLIRQLSNKYDDEELVNVMEEEMKEYPFLVKNNYFQMFYFYACSDVSEEAFFDDDGELGEKYFTIAMKTRIDMEDSEVLDNQGLGMLYAEKGAYYYRRGQYKKALDILNEGKSLVPEHARIIARLKIVNSKLNGGVVDEDDVEDEDMDVYLEEE